LCTKTINWADYKTMLVATFLRAALLLSIILFTMTTEPMAQERGCMPRFHFNLNSEGPWPVYMNVKSGHQCGNHYWRAGGTTAYKMLYLVTKAQHGTVSLHPQAHFIYSSKAGYAGEDSFTLKVCGTTHDRPACADLLVHVTVN
jgi:hypothetical protein